MSTENENIDKKIRAYKIKYYKKRLLKGSALFLGILLLTFLAFSLIEHWFRLNQFLRAVLFFTFIGGGMYFVYQLIIKHLVEIRRLDKHLTDEVAARQIGTVYPDIGDRLLNLVQLKRYSSNDLAQASIFQRTGFLRTYEFTNAIRLSETYKYWRWAAAIFMFLALIYFVQPEIIRNSPERIINYNREFVPVAPFTFEAFDHKEIAFKNEDYTVKVKITGDAIPEQVYLSTRSRRIKMDKAGMASFSHTFRKIQNDITYKFEAAGYNSQTYSIEVVNRPQLGDFNVTFQYPPYLKRGNERLENTGHFEVPEGTKVEWQIQPRNTENISLLFYKDPDTLNQSGMGSNPVKFDKVLSKGTDYEIKLHNEYSENKEPIVYHAKVIPDNHPEINVNFYQDTVLYRFIMMSGNISDDYGLSRLNLYYRVKSGSDNEKFSSIRIPIASGQNSQSFNYEWLLDSLNIHQGEVLQYFLQVWDNDGVNGAKAAKTGMYTFKVPDKKALKEELKNSSDKTEKNIDQTLEEARQLNRKLEETTQRLKGKKNRNWQDDKQLKELLNKREQLNKALEELREQHRNQEMKRDRFNPENEKTKEKVQQLQQLMDELLDEETKKLYEELEKLLEEQKNMDKIQDLLDKMQNRESNLEKELERTLELFKKLRFENKLDQTLEELEELRKEQEQLAEETQKDSSDEAKPEDKDSEEGDDKSEKGDESNSEEGKKDTSEEPEDSESKESDTEEANSDKQESSEKNSEKQEKQNSEDASNEELSNKQEEIQEKFEELQKEMEEMEKMNQDRKNPQALPEDLNEQKKSIEQEMEKAKEQLKQNNKNKAKESQNNASDKMKQMKEQLSQMQSNMEMEMMMENLNDLRHIVHNLLKLSFDQEELMKEFKNVQQSDPRFVTLSQEQLKIMDDSRIIEDSLQSLASRVLQIQSFVTRELSEMNNHLEKTTEAIRERIKSKAASEQQFAMTSMNNLAVLLDDVLEQMQSAMAEAMGNPMPSDKKSDSPSLGEMQQDLNQKIEDLKKSGKSGRELSEELAKLAAQQERIRKQLQEMQEKYGEGEDDGQLSGNGIPEKMEETEIDLVNKQITEETIKRQREIMVRLLEAEKSMRERDLDEERKGETANPVEREVPPSFDEYFKQKQQEIELLKTIPPKLFPYYRKEVNEYFKRLGNSVE